MSKNLLTHPLFVGIIGGVVSLVVGTLILYWLGIVQLINPGLSVEGSVDSSILTVGQSGGTNTLVDGRATERLKYYYVSTLNVYGSDITAGRALTVRGPLIDLLRPYLADSGAQKFTWNCGPDALAAYSKAIQDFPLYPFAYFFLGTCKNQNDSNKGDEYIKEAERILEITTSIEGHHINHDEILEMINEKSYNFVK